MIYKFKDWVDTENIGWYFVCSNPKAIRIIEQNPHKIDWQYLSLNENAIPILEKNLDNIFWDWLGKNKGAIDLMKKNWHGEFWYSIGENENALDLIEHPNSRFWGHLELNTNPRAVKLLEDKIKHGYVVHWTELARNHNAIHLFEQNLEKVNEQSKHGGLGWRILSRYEHGIHLLEQNPDKVHWPDFNAWNPCAIRILEKYPERINWSSLSQNKYAVPLLEKNLDKVDWVSLSGNENAVHILETYPDKIDWPVLSINPNAGHLLAQNLDKKDQFLWHLMGLYDHIYEIDYKYLEDRCNVYKEELVLRTMHPSRLNKYVEDWHDIETIFGFM